MIYQEKYKNLYLELECMETAGLSFLLEEKPASAVQVVIAHMVKDPNTYMRDYIFNRKGRILQISFDEIVYKS